MRLRSALLLAIVATLWSTGCIKIRRKGEPAEVPAYSAPAYTPPPSYTPPSYTPPSYTPPPSADGILPGVALPAISCGSGPECNSAGLDYRDGLSGKMKDDRMAAAYFKRGCELGEGGACSDLGYASQRGIGIPLDLAQSANLYRIGCEKGSSLACGNFGISLRDGIGIGADRLASRPFFERACVGGQGFACDSIGHLVQDGNGIPVDLTASAAWFVKACELKDAHACSDAGWAYAKGRGVPADVVRGKLLLDKGCQGGNPWAASGSPSSRGSPLRPSAGSAPAPSVCRSASRRASHRPRCCSRARCRPTRPEHAPSRPFSQASRK